MNDSTNTWDTIARCQQRLRETTPLPLEQHLFLRVLKIQEETGEVADALLGVLGGTPRKGVCKTEADLQAEICDVIATAMVALVETAGPDAERIFAAHIDGWGTPEGAR